MTIFLITIESKYKSRDFIAETFFRSYYIK